MPLYKAIIEHWKSCYTLQYKEEIAPSKFDPNLKYFSEKSSSLSSHPIVKKASSHAKSGLLVLQLYNYLDFLIWAEQGPVNEAVENMGMDDFFPQLSRDIVQGAKSVNWQEKRHSSWAYDLFIGVHHFTGVAPVDSPPYFLHIMEEVLDKDKTLEPLIKLLFVVIAELLDLRTAEILQSDETVQQPVRDFAEKHEIEEKLHRVYFRKVFEEVWSRLPSDIQRRLGVLLPKMFLAYLVPDEKMLNLMLEEFPNDFSGTDIDYIVSDLTNPEIVRNGIRTNSLEILDFMDDFGVFKDPVVAEAFRIVSLMPQSFSSI